MDFLTTFLQAAGIEVPASHALLYLLLVCLGAFGHVANVVYVKKECESVAMHFKTKPAATVTMAIGILGGWIGLIQINETSLYTYIMTGFICDSIFNRFVAGQAASDKLDQANSGRSRG